MDGPRGPAEPEAEPAVVVERSEEPEPDAEEIVAELVEAEAVVVPLPSSQRRVPASEVLDEFGVPIARSGVARRLGGYDALAGWRP